MPNSSGRGRENVIRFPEQTGRKSEPDSVTKEVKSMMIHEEICVGCGRCQPACPTAAIRYDGLKSRIDQDVCWIAAPVTHRHPAPSTRSPDRLTSTTTRGRCAGISAIPAPPIGHRHRAAEPRSPRRTTLPCVLVSSRRGGRCRHRDRPAHARAVDSGHPEDHPAIARAGQSIKSRRTSRSTP